jgi:PhzF family phenazine biosynthesis protein
MSRRAFKQVDVFTAEAYRGNALAVVLDGRGLAAEEMQRFTDWSNLSEATFLLPPTHPQADYAVRIFCPGQELPFAGHPTLGSCHAWLETGGVPRGGATIVQQCGVGLVPIRRDGARLAFAAPPLQRGGPLDTEALDRLVSGLGLAREAVVAHGWCDNGPPWHGLLLHSAQDLLELRPNPALLAGQFVGVVAPWPPGHASGCDYEVRTFFPGGSGLIEDPVTGSFNAALAQWLTGSGLAPPRYVVRQGTVLGRAGRVYLERDSQGQVWVGGDVVTCIDGQVELGAGLGPH